MTAYELDPEPTVLHVAHDLAAGYLRRTLSFLGPSNVRLVAQAVLTAGHAR